VTVTSLGTRPGGLLVVGVLVYAAAASLTTPLTPIASFAVLVPVVIVLVPVSAWHPRAETRVLRGHLSRTALAWGVVVGLTALWDVLAWVQQPAYNVAAPDHPTISLLLDPLTGSPLPRFLLWSAWLYVGFRLARR